MTANKVLKRDFLFLASQRSGHHAVMGWVLSAFVGPKLYLNHVHPRDGKPLGMEGWHAAIKKCKQATEVNCAIYNIENAELDQLDGYKTVKRRAKMWLPKHEPTVTDAILVVRDPFNTLAAAVKLGLPKYPPGKIKKMAARLIRHYRCALGQEKPTRLNPYIISFNEWFASVDYRAKIVSELDLDLDPVPQFRKLQGRSSFDLHKHKKDAHKMNVLDRYQSMMGNEQFLKLFDRYPELVSLSERLFGINPFE